MRDGAPLSSSASSKASANTNYAAQREKLVEFHDVQLAYDPRRPVLKNVNLTIANGDFWFLTGTSGSGKTTFLKMIYMALQPTKGHVSLFGERIDEIDPQDLPLMRRRLGVVFQDFSLIDHLSAFDNVALPMRVAGYSLSEYQKDVIDLLEWVGLGKKIDTLPASLSGGEKQRVALARALVAKPDIILADEPTGNVDPLMGERIMRLLIELNRLGTAVIVATHDINLVKKLRKNILRIKEGEVYRHGPMRQDDEKR